MALIDISNLTFAYEGSYDNIFENVSFQIDTDWKLGLTGRNGRGKTTFLHLLLNKFEYKGAISAPCGFDYFPFDIPGRSMVTEKIIDSIFPDYPSWELARELNLLELEEEILYRPFFTLSNGECTKVLLAALFLKENNFLLIDEPTNHLDMQGRELVSRYLKTKKGFILVSHDRAFLDGCIDHVLSINRANIEIQKGNFSAWWLNKERRDRFELAENEKLKKEIKRLEKTAREKAAWSDKTEKSKIGSHIYDRGYVGHKAAKMMKKSKVIESRQQSALEEKSTLLKNLEKSDALRVTQLEYHTNRLVSLRGVSIYYGDKTACENVSLAIEKGDRIALCGKNGTGKSSILKLINGGSLAYSGEFLKGSRLLISYVSQETSHLSGSLENYIEENNLDESLFKAILRKLDLARIQFEKHMEDYSGGQKKKLLIAKSLCEKAHLLVWDEPLNYIDVISRIQIEKLLLEYSPTIIFVEHDHIFCDKIATDKITLS